MSDIDTAAADSLKVLDPKRPIREADIVCELPLKQGSRPLELPDSSEFHCRMSERLSGDASKR